MTNTKIRFTVRRKGGALAGQTIEHDVPEFEWAAFKNTPNAEAFVRKAYYAAAQRLVREVLENRNGMTDRHLQSLESLIARSLCFSREEIEDWCDSRDWRKAVFAKDREEGIAILKKHLPQLSATENQFPDQVRARAAEIVADVADSRTDPVADYLWVRLTQVEKPSGVLSVL